MEMAIIMIRLDKFLADMGAGTRAEVKKYIRQGMVEVDGVIVKSPETKVDIDTQKVVCQGKPIVYEHFVYYMLNKNINVYVYVKK